MNRFRTRLITAAGVSAMLFGVVMLLAMQSADFAADERQGGGRRNRPGRRLRPRN